MQDSNPTSAIVPFNFEGLPVRAVNVDDTAWIVAADVCAGLNLGDTSSALRRVEDDDKKRFRRSDTPQFFQGIAPQVQEITVVNESGLYALIFQSRTEQARKFKRWVTSEVLPSIRTNGSYAVVPAQRGEVAVSGIDLIIAMAQELKRAEETAQKALASSSETSARLDAIEGKHDWFAGLAYAKLNGLPTSTTYLQRLGKAASKIGRSRGLTVSKVQHGLYGEVNQWPAWVWELAVEERRV